jgi:PQQ-like domain
VKRQLAGILLMAALAAGCATKRMLSTSVVTSSDGSAVYGAFVEQAQARLNPDAPLTNLVAAGDAVYAYTAENQVYALSQGLEIRFLRQVVGKYEALRPAVQVGEEVIFPSSVGLVVLAKNGEPIRTLSLDHPLTSNVQVDQRGLLLAGTAAPTGGRLAVIDPRDPAEPNQQDTLLGNIESAPAAFQGIIFAGTDAGRVFAVASENRTAWGLEELSFNTRRPIKADLVVDEFGVFVASTDGTLYALNRADGRIRWRYMAEAPLMQTPLVTRDRVFQIVPGQGLVAIDKLDGKLYREPLWTAQGVTRLVSVDDRYVYAVRDNDTLIALGLNDGKEKFSATGRFDFVAAGPDNTIFAATRDGAVVSLKRGAYTGDAVATK